METDRPILGQNAFLASAVSLWRENLINRAHARNHHKREADLSVLFNRVCSSLPAAEKARRSRPEGKKEFIITVFRDPLSAPE